MISPVVIIWWCVMISTSIWYIYGASRFLSAWRYKPTQSEKKEDVKKAMLHFRIARRAPELAMIAATTTQINTILLSLYEIEIHSNPHSFVSCVSLLVSAHMYPALHGAPYVIRCSYYIAKTGRHTFKNRETLKMLKKFSNSPFFQVLALGGFVTIHIITALTQIAVSDTWNKIDHRPYCHIMGQHAGEWYIFAPLCCLYSLSLLLQMPFFQKSYDDMYMKTELTIAFISWIIIFFVYFTPMMLTEVFMKHTYKVQVTHYFLHYFVILMNVACNYGMLYLPFRMSDQKNMKETHASSALNLNPGKVLEMEEIEDDNKDKHIFDRLDILDAAKRMMCDELALGIRVLKTLQVESMLYLEQLFKEKAKYHNNNENEFIISDTLRDYLNKCKLTIEHAKEIYLNYGSSDELNISSALRDEWLNAVENWLAFPEDDIKIIPYVGVTERIMNVIALLLHSNVIVPNGITIASNISYLCNHQETLAKIREFKSIAAHLVGDSLSHDIGHTCEAYTVDDIVEIPGSTINPLLH